MIPILIAAVLGTVLAQIRLSQRFASWARVVLLAQALIAFLAYVARPLVQFVIHPDHSNPLYDQRLAQDTYGASMQTPLLCILAGQSAALVVVWLMSKSIKNEDFEGEKKRQSDPEVLVAGAWVTLGISWIGRVCLVVGLVSVGKTVAPFGSAAAALILLFLPNARRSRISMLVVVTSEVAWSLLFASKGPVFAVLLALAVRLASERGRLLRAVPLMALLALGIFSVIQPLKGVSTAARVSDYSASSSPAIGLGYSVLERFDGESAVVDAVAAYPEGGWYSWPGYVGLIANSTLPALVADSGDATLGQKWTREVRARTIDNQFLSVSLAFGPQAEGWAVGGPIGAVVFSALFQVALVLLARSLHLGARRAYLAFSAYMIFSSSVLESSLLGLATAAVKGVEFTLLLAAAWLVVEAMKTKESGIAVRASSLEGR